MLSIQLMKRTTLFLFFVLYLYNSAFSQPQKLYFDPGTASGIPEARIFDEIKYIPLETKRESLFGKISQLIVTDKYFVIYDTDTKAIYFFQKDGKFAKKFKFKGYEIKTILFDENRNALLITGLNKNYSPSQKNIQAMIDDPVHNSSIKYTRAIYYYLSDDKDGQTEVINDFDMALANPSIINTNHWVYSYIYANRSWPDTEDYELKVSDGKRITHTFFPYSRKTSSIYYGAPQRINFYKTGDINRLLFTRPFQYGIYELTPDSVKELYTVVLPASSSIPQTFFSENFSSRTSLEDFKMKNSGLAWGVNNVIDLNRYLFFTLDFFRNFRGRNFIFDKETTMFFNQSRITSDSTNNFLPVLGTNAILANDQKYLYSSITSSAMFQNMKANEKRNLPYDPVIKEYFEKGKPDDNPVIIVLKPKTNQ